MPEKQSAQPDHAPAREKPRPAQDGLTPEAPAALPERLSRAAAPTPPPEHPTITPLRRAALQRTMQRSGNRSVTALVQRAVIQRQPAGGGSGADINAWPTIIPDAPLGTTVTVPPAAHGQDPKATVNLPQPAPGTQPGTNAQPGAGGQPDAGQPAQPDPRQQQIEALCRQIDANRAGINERFMIRAQHTIQKVTGIFGYQYTPDREKLDSGAEAGDRQAAADYMAWLSTAEPTAIQKAGGQAALSGRLKAQFELWKDIGGEGQTAAMNTYDGENLTWGRGFTASGQLQNMMNGLFAMDPAARTEFLHAGIDLQGNDFLAVDTQLQIKLRGKNAEKFIKVDRRLVSVFVNVAMSPQHRQAVLDLNWQQFVSGTGNIPPEAVGWPREARGVAGHNIHGGHFSWASFAGAGTLTAVIAVIGRKFGKASPEGGIVVPEWVTEKRLRKLSRGYAMAALGTPVRWGWTYTGPNPENPPEMTEANKEQWKQEGFTAPNLYFATNGGNAYFVLTP